MQPLTASAVDVPEAVDALVTALSGDVAQTRALAVGVTRNDAARRAADAAARVTATRLTLTLGRGQRVAIVTGETAVTVETVRVEDALQTLASHPAKPSSC